MFEFNPSQDQKHLPVHEWIAVASILALLFGLTGVVLWNGESIMPEKVGNPHFLSDPEIEVWVEGAVEHPGMYRMKRGSLLKDALALATPVADANLKKMNLDKKLRSGQVVKVSCLQVKKVKSKKDQKRQLQKSNQERSQ